MHTTQIDLAEIACWTRSMNIKRVVPDIESHRIDESRALIQDLPGAIQRAIAAAGAPKSRV